MVSPCVRAGGVVHLLCLASTEVIPMALTAFQYKSSNNRRARMAEGGRILLVLHLLCFRLVQRFGGSELIGFWLFFELGILFVLGL